MKRERGIGHEKMDRFPMLQSGCAVCSIGILDGCVLSLKLCLGLFGAEIPITGF